MDFVAACVVVLSGQVHVPCMCFTSPAESPHTGRAAIMSSDLMISAHQLNFNIECFWAFNMVHEVVQSLSSEVHRNNVCSSTAPRCLVSLVIKKLPGSSRKSELKQPDHNGRYLTNNCTSEHDLNKMKSWWSNNLLCCVFLQFHVRVIQRLNLASGPGIRVCPREAGNILKALKAWDIRCSGITGMAIRKKKEGTSADFRNCREDFRLKMVEGSEAILSNLGGVPSPLLGSFQTTAFRFGTQPFPPCSLLLGHANRSPTASAVGYTSPSMCTAGRPPRNALSLGGSVVLKLQTKVQSAWRWCWWRDSGESQISHS